MLTRSFAMLALLCTFTACASNRSLETLRQAVPTGDAYQKALAANYRDYAEQNADAYAWEISTYFADKGLIAASGGEVTPEDPTRWNLPAAGTVERSEVRGKLLTAITANRSTQPELSASATLAYDHWLVLMHHHMSDTMIRDQGEVFFALLSTLQEVHTDNAPVAEEPSAELAGSPAPIPAEQALTVLYFPLDSDHFGDSAQMTVAALARTMQAADKVTININGHADRSGSDAHNMDLSERRARFVLQALKKAGISEKIMNYFAFGESDPAVPTADGVPEPKNRRVEIVIE